LTHFYNVDFEVKDETIYGDTFTGKFQNVQLPQILEYLKISSKINYTTEYSEDRDGVKKTVIHLKKISNTKKSFAYE